MTILRRGTFCSSFPIVRVLAVLTVAVLGHGPEPSLAKGKPAEIPGYCKNAKSAGLPLPKSLSPAEYQKVLNRFLNERKYAALGWCEDKGVNASLVRDTGPYINNVYYGTHPAVRVYYSPKFMKWLTGDRSKPVEDGAIVVKEMFEAPAARYVGMDGDKLLKHLKAWTVMVRQASGAHDGWYWANPSKANLKPDQDTYPFAYPNSGFGQYCIRCHASAKDNATFATTRNIKGFSGEPIRFRVDDSWRAISAAEKPWTPHDFSKYQQNAIQHSPGALNAAPAPPAPPPQGLFQKTFPLTTNVKGGAAGKKPVQKMPSETLDRIVAKKGSVPGFLSSDQCLTCHGGLNGNKETAAGPVMFLQTGSKYGAGYNVSPYGEWRWSPMGLAGRDPIFHAQLDSEVSILRKEFSATPKKAETLVRHLTNTCLSCHAVMGQRQLKQDAGKLGLDPLFKREYLHLGAKDRSNPYFKYGALGRDGISCSVCHRMQPPKPDPVMSDLKNYLTNATTGRFQLGKPGEIFGPFKDKEIVTLPMKNALAMTPRFSAYIKSSRLCGSCHMVNLPNVDQPRKGQKPTMLDAGQTDPVFKPFKHSIEQATYLEWLNSAYQNEFPDKNPTPKKMKSCQGCHMPKGFKSADGRIDIKQLQTRIAAIQDATYPEADHLAAEKEINVRFRKKGFRRHRFQGLNGFLVQMFAQADDILGVRKEDYMTGADGLKQAMENFSQQARERTVGVKISKLTLKGRRLDVSVNVVNKTGHRFPSGVGFRRAFLELAVVNKETGKVVWASGRTNSVGVIVDDKANPLKTEFFERGADGKQRYQSHHEVITRQDQVQIYEELITNAKGVFTTSFIHRKNHIKDNRLLPLGWRGKGHDQARYSELKAFVDATHPGARAAQDADYRDGKGHDTTRYQITLPEGVEAGDLAVRATIYYQSIPPSWLRQRFETAPDMPATKRLHFIASRLKLDNTPFRHWKFKLVTAQADVSSSSAQSSGGPRHAPVFTRQ